MKPAHLRSAPLQGLTLADLTAQLQASLVERYAIEGELGRGGMATVYLARDVRHNRQVALKVLRPELTALLGRERFLNEIRLTAQLDHPNILTLIDSGEANGLLYYVLPFVRGESLRDRLDREGQLGLDDAVRIGTQIASALEYAHQHGIIHRDIKPGNILLHEGVAMVADFGIALALWESGGERLTETGLSLGTPQYMSPEQASGGRQLDARSDIYSLAAVVYEMLTGEPPFSGPSGQAVIAKLISQRPVSIRALRDSVSAPLEAAVLKALSRTPADRFPTASAFATALGSAAQPAPASISPAFWATIVVVAAGAALAGAWRWGGLGKAVGHALSATQAEGPLEHQRIAVLYFHPKGDDPDLSSIADGVTEGLIDTLRRVAELEVRPSNSVVPFRGTSASGDSVARLLNVESLVKGGVEKVGDRFRVQVQLVDGSTGAASEPRSFEGSLEEMVPIQGELARAVVTMLKAKPHYRANAWLIEQRARQARRLGDSLEASGDSVGFILQYTRADSLAAIAAQLDPTWVDPILLRGTLAYWRSRRATENPDLAATMIDSGLVFAERAWALSKDDPDVLELRGNLRYWRWLLGLESDASKAAQLLKQAQTDLEAAVKLNPSQAGAWGSLSHLYNQTGSGVDVNTAAGKAYRADPYISNADVILSRLFFSSYDLGQFTDALHWCEEGERRFPGNPKFGECQLWLLTTKVKDPDVGLAWRLADSVTAQSAPEDTAFQRHNTRLIVAAVLARSGQADSAKHMVTRYKGDAELDPTRDLAYISSFVYTLTGDKDEALQQLKTYLAATPGRRASFAEDPGWWFRDLTKDPRYQALVAAPH